MKLRTLALATALVATATAAFAGPTLRSEVVVTAPIVTVGDMFDDASALAERALAIATRLKGHAPLTMRATKTLLGRLRDATPAIDDDDKPLKKPSHEIGQELSLLSVKELEQRIALMQAEIARLEADIAGKRASRSAADLFFKK